MEPSGFELELEHPSDSEVFSAARQRWLSWNYWLNATVSSDPTVDDVLALLRSYVGSLPPPEDRRISDFSRRALFALGVDFRHGGVAAGQGAFFLEKQSEFGGIWYRPTASLGHVNWQSGRPTVAHELGHVVLYSLVNSQTVGEAFRAAYNDHNKAEWFCETFANLVLQDAHRPDAGLWDDVEARMSLESERLGGLIQDRSGLRITIQHLYKLAGMRGWSVRRAIAWLHSSAALASAECGIAVFRVAVHPKPTRTKSSGPVLRVWQVALPPWGFLPRLRRAATSGFSKAAEAFDNIETGKTWIASETLKISEKCEAVRVTSSTKFRRRSLGTTCAYTPIDVRAEGRYLVAIWEWKQTPPPTPPSEE